MSQEPVAGRDGALRLTEEQRRRWGLMPGAEFVVEERPEDHPVPLNVGARPI